MVHKEPAVFEGRSFVSGEMCDAFDSLMNRLEAVIETETTLLQRHCHSGLAESTRQKRQGVMELNRMMRSLDQTVPSQTIIARLGEFRRRLAQNDAALQIELRAVQAVTDTMVGAMREAESDGTYSRSQGAFAEFE